MDERNILIWDTVSQRLGEILQDKEAMLQSLAALRQYLTENPQAYRANRDDVEPDCLFNLPVRILLRGRWRVIRFPVSDSTSPDDYIVESVSIS